MKLLQRYIVGELLRVFSLLVIVLTVLLVFVGVLREAADQVVLVLERRHGRGRAGKRGRV